ncbi:MAG: hypothetical protein FWG53_07250 [Clostridiales bacterium]|nr:hypothetical protein [Clostridiales bacterium]
MAPMVGRLAVSESLKTILICVDSYEDSCIEGSVFHGSFKDGRRFSNLMQLLLTIEDILDDTGFPKATTEKRRFNTFKQIDRETKIVDGRLDFEALKGKLATFRLKIIFRHNASWQGSVAWMEDNDEEPFRSALELLMLMDSALSG